MSEPESWIDEEGNTHYGTTGKVSPYGKQGPTVHIKIDKSQQMKDLEAENKKMSEQLLWASKKEFDRRTEIAMEQAEKHNIDVGFINNPDELKIIERQIENAKGKKISSREIPLNASQLGFKNPNNEGLPIEQRSYSNLKELFDDLDQEAKAGNKDAQKAMVRLAQKTKDHKLTEFEFQGKITEKEKDPSQKLKWKRLR